MSPPRPGGPTVREPRSMLRGSHPTDARLGWLEDDLDDVDTAFEAMAADLASLKTATWSVAGILTAILTTLLGAVLI